MASRKEVPGCVDIIRTRSRKPEKAGHVYVITRAAGNRRILDTSELLSSKRRAFANIAATARVYGTIAYSSPLIRDFTGPEVKELYLDLSGPRWKVVEL